MSNDVGLSRRHLLSLTAATLAASSSAARVATAQSAFLDDPLRPQFHFTPPRDWMNDPNGLVYVDGEYHLFYQHYPRGYAVGGPYADSLRWGPMHWGHAVSRDLVRWRHLPIALAPDAPPGTSERPIRGTIFSGSAVVDWNDTSGLGDGATPPVIAMYTQSDLTVNPVEANQRQSIAVSNDGGLTFTKFDRNPVIPNRGTRDFRDPKVFWHEPTGRWVMVLAARDRVELFTSPDLKGWAFASAFGGDGWGARGLPWECPDLFPLPVDDDPANLKWVLIVSVAEAAVAGGSGTQYFIGAFDGTTFKADGAPSDVNWLGYGPDDYAGVTWSDHPGNDRERLFIGWMSNWEYARTIPATVQRNAMTLPRVLTLRTLDGAVRLIARPLPALESLREPEPLYSRDRLSLRPGDDLFRGLAGDTLELLLDLDTAAGDARGVELRLRVGDGEETLVAYDVARGELAVDRSRSGAFAFAPEVPPRHTAPLPPRAGRVSLHAFLDRTSLELFANDGERSTTTLIFPKPTSTGLSLTALGGTARLATVRVYRLGSIWA